MARAGWTCGRRSRSQFSTRGTRIQTGYRIDLLIDDVVLVEIKAVAKLLPIHEAQLLSYLKLSGRPLGLLINFHVRQLKAGITRMVR